MPTVTTHSSNNLVTVSYPVREAQLDITQAEHELILMFSNDKAMRMIKFISSQYNLSLHDAKQVVDTVIVSAENKPEVQLQGGTAETEVDWSAIPEGTWIYVKDHLYGDWDKREFIRYNPDSVFSFVCKSSDDEREITWQRAKLIND